jgi:hypothetical protein
MYPCAVRNINTHAEAMAFYDACPTRKGQDYGDERLIKGKENSPQLGVRIVHNAVKFRYHRTDVVTWHPSNSYTVSTYMSRSTCEFASWFIPKDHHLTFSGTVLVTGDIMHPVVGSITVKSGYVSHEHVGTVFQKKRIDRKAAKRVLAQTRYAEYRAWHKAMSPLVRGHMPTAYFRDDVRLEMIADESKWHDLMMSYESHPDKIRELIYLQNYQEVYYYENCETLPRSWNLKGWRVACV